MDRRESIRIEQARTERIASATVIRRPWRCARVTSELRPADCGWRGGPDRTLPLERRLLAARVPLATAVREGGVEMKVGKRRPWRGVTGALCGLAVITLAAGGVTSSAPPGAVDGAAAEPAAVERQIFDELAGGGSTDFWVYLRGRADLGRAAGITDRAGQGAFV